MTVMLRICKKYCNINNQRGQLFSISLNGDRDANMYFINISIINKKCMAERSV